jgi:Domain of unknown function (DUF4345)
MLALIMGGVCLAIGVFHIVGGVASVPGEAHAGATVDSRERFYGVVFAAYGLAWLWAGRQRELPLALVRGLAVVLFLGGVARLLSFAVYGAPQWFQTVLLVVELVVPVVFVVLTHDERDTDAGAATHSRGGVARR